MRVALAVLAGCLMGLTAGRAPAQRLYVRNYGQHDGLPAAQVFIAYQDRRSFLWFGTSSGLARYDGHQFQTFTVDDGLLHDSVRSVVEYQGALYLTGEKGVTRLNPDGQFTRFTTADGLGDGIIWRVVQHQGQLWFGSSSGGLSRFDGRRFHTFTTRDGLPSNNVFALLSDGDRLWIGTRGGGLVLLERGQLRTLGPNDGLPARQVMALTRIGETLWVGTRDGGIFSRVASGRFVRQLAEVSVYSVGQRGDELFWGTLGQGVIRMRPRPGPRSRPVRGSADEARHIWTWYGTDNGLAGDRIYSVLVDREDSVWFTTNAGVTKLLSDKFVSYLPGSNILSVAQHRKAIWLGTLGQGLMRLDNTVEGQQPVPVLEQMGKQNVWSLASYRDRLWIGTADGLYSTDDGETATRHTLTGAPPFDGIYDILPLSDRLYLATTGGICVYDTVTSQCRTYTREQQLAGNVNYSGTVWRGMACFGAEGGVSCIDREGKIQTFGPKDGLPSSTVYVVFTDAAGRLWAGTNRGLARREKDSFVVFDRSCGLSHNLVTAVAQLQHRMLVCTNGGLNVLQDGRVTRVYRQKTGMISNEVNFSAILIDARRNVWMGTTRGLARYVADRDQPNRVPPPIWIERCLVNGSEVAVGSSKMELSHDRRNLAFSYVGLSFKDEENVAYSFKLVGYDASWSPPGSEHSVRYTNLPPGRYAFHVRARNADGFWSVRPASLSFSIMPPFWRTWWFIGLCLAGLLLSLFVGVRLRLRRIRHDYLRLEQLVRDRTRQLEEAAERLKDLSLTDPLTGLRNRRYLREMIGAEVARVRRSHQDLRGQGAPGADKYLGFILIDVDHFKEVNDTFGHEVGDALILAYAERLQLALRSEDVVVRWGGEEFLVLCHDVNPDSLHQLALRVVQRLRQEPYDLPGDQQLPRTCTAGFSTYPFGTGMPDLFNHETVINFADHAMYVGKRNGRDLVVGIVAGEQAIPEADQDRVKRDLAYGVERGYLRLLCDDPRQLEL